MAFTVEDFSDLIRLLEEHPEWRAQLRALILPQEVLSLPEQLARLTQAVYELAQAQAASSARLETLLVNQEQRLARLEELIAQQSARLDRQEERLARLEELASQHSERLARLEELIAQQSARLDKHEERLARLEELAAEHAERLARLEDLIAQQSARLDKHEERLARLEERMDLQERTLAELVETVRNLIEVVTKLVQRVDRLEQRQAKLSGFYYEVHYRERAPAYFGRLLKRARGLLPHELEEMVENHLSQEEMQEFYLADAIVRGIWREDNEPVFFAMEVSETIDANDVVWAIRRAQLLRKAGLRALPAVAGESRNNEALDLAVSQGVLMITDGRVENVEMIEQSLSASG